MSVISCVLSCILVCTSVSERRDTITDFCVIVYKTSPVEIVYPLTVTSVVNPAATRHTRLSAANPRNVYLTYRNSTANYLF